MARPVERLNNMKFGFLSVVRRIKSSASGQPRWKCQCVCGNMVDVEGRYLRNGRTTSCGCMVRANRAVSSRIAVPIGTMDFLTQGDDPYQNLANAIVATAAIDYIDAIENENSEEIAELEEFFFSDWYKVLSRVDAETLVSVLREDAAGKISTVNI